MMSDHVQLPIDEELNAVKEPVDTIVLPNADLPNDEVDILISLSSLLLANVKTPSYNLLPEQIEWINKFIEASPEVFDIILKDIIAITADGMIDSHDIPLIIKLITDIYNSRAIARNMANSKNIIAFVKFTLEVILDSKYIVLPEIEKTIIKGLIESSISLLSMNVASDNKGVVTSICTFVSKFAVCFSASPKQ
jgi:hypothetical protein